MHTCTTAWVICSTGWSLFKVGVLIGCSIINGGSSYLFFTPSRYQYITGTLLQNVTVSIDYVPSLDV